MTTRNKTVFTIAALAILALAVGQAQAIVVDVPNGDFQTIYKPDTSGTVTATVPDGCYWSIPNLNIKGPEGAVATYSDGSTGDSVETPGWVQGTPDSKDNSDCMQGGTWGGPDGEGDIAFLCFAAWGGPTYIESAAPLSIPPSGSDFTLSAEVAHAGRPLVLELRVDGVALTPDSESSPEPVTGEWVVFTREYSTIPAGDVKILVGTRNDGQTFGTDPDTGEPILWSGNRASVDNVTLDVQSIDPALPDVDAGPDMISWSGAVVTLDPNVVKNDPGTLTYLWTAEPDGIGDPNLDVAITGATSEDASVTVTKIVPTGGPTVVTMTLTVTLAGKGSVIDSMQIAVYDDACLAAKAVGPVVIDRTDVDDNCITDFKDFAVMATTWLDNYILTEAVVK